MIHIFRRETLEVPPDGLADMEDSLTFVGFGKFQLLIMAYSIIAAMSITFATTMMSYVITSAECDLNLSLMQKGQLNASVYIGMTIGVIVSGCISDTLGRRRTLIYGFLTDCLFNFIASFCKSFPMLITLKFFAGLLICGPCTILLSCMSEFFSKRTRAMFSMYISMCISLGALTLALVAWGLLENPSDYHITSTNIIHSWQIFIAICSIPSLTAGLCSILVPESPRFLAATGKINESLDVLKYMYEINTGQPAHTYPVKRISIQDITLHSSETDIIENESRFQKFVRFSKMWFLKLKLLFHKPHICNLLISFVMESGSMTGVTLRLWMPQLFKLMNENMHHESEPVCEIIELSSNVSILDPTFSACVPIIIPSDIFVRNVAICVVQIIVTGSLTYLITIIGKRTLLMLTLFIGGVCCSSIVLNASPLVATILSAIVIAFSAAGSSANVTAVMYLIPTDLRATAVAVILAVGRMASIIANIVYPILMKLGCLYMFLTIGFILIGCSFFAILLPKPKRLT